MVQKILKVKNSDCIESVNNFLKEILKSGKIHALLVQQDVPSKKISFPVFITDPDRLNADVFSPILPSSTATIVSRITKFQPPKEPIGVVMRACQIRALIELVKLNQANLDNIIIIGIDCLGTYPLNKYTNFTEKHTPTQYLIDDFNKKTKNAEKYIRPSCLICKDPIPTNADITIGIFGMNINDELLVEANSETGKKLIEDLKLDSVKELKSRENAVQEIRNNKTKNR